MDIVIHTYGRRDRQYTWWNLSQNVRNRTTLVVQYCERHLYPEFPVHVLPPHITTLGETRQFLYETTTASKLCILDDDLDFAVRREDEPTRFRAASENDIDHMFKEIESLTGDTYGYPLVGVAAREGANFDTNQYRKNTRQMRLHAIDVTLYRRLGIRFDRVQVMEDFDVTLQFLEAGYSNLVLNQYVTNQHGSNTAGGCSHYRTPQVQRESAEELARLHPGIVTVVRKQTKTSWGGQERTDVRISWQKAHKQGTARLLDAGEGKNKAEEGTVFTKAMD